MSQAAIGLPRSESRPRASMRRRVGRWLRIAAWIAAGVAAVWFEGRESRLQALVFHAASRSIVAPTADAPPPSVDAGPPEILAPARSGPYDDRLGYADLPRLVARAERRGFRVERAAQPSPGLRAARTLGLAPPYPEKQQAGLRIVDGRGTTLFAATWPRQVYARFEDVPEPVVAALLFVENRELLDARHPTWNPVLEWDRLARAALAYPLRLVGDAGHPIGGSTLATQIQKFRHSPGGRTDGPVDKLRQILSASLSIYRDGTETTAARRRVVVDYLNSVPLAALAGYGEVFGVGDGLRLWMGADFEEVNALLRASGGDVDRMAERGRAFRQVLALILAAQRPSDFLRADPAALERRTEAFLASMSAAQVLPEPLLAAARAAGPVALARRAEPSASPARDRALAAPARTALAEAIGAGDVYALDRLDLTAETTLEAAAQGEVRALLASLRAPGGAADLGLVAPRLLGSGGPGDVQYAITLWERRDGEALLRVQTDSWAGAFDPSDGARLDLGSTAKLRTAVHYLEIVADDHRAFAGRPPGFLDGLVLDRADVIGRWVVEQLRARPDLSLEALLDAALDRRYSASPDEVFFTGGGRHRFHNYDPDDDARVLTVRVAFRRSVNLPFIRLMRDLANHHAVALVGDPTRLVEDRSDPRRREWLQRFADHESRVYLDRFYRRYQGVRPEAATAALLPPRRRTPERLAALLRGLEPDAPLEAFAASLRSEGVELPEPRVRSLYERNGPDRLGLLDRAWLTRTDPLELWVAARLRAEPEIRFADLLAESERARAEAYAWLFRTRRQEVADRAIRVAVERAAFERLGRAWQRLGYPFPDVVPSYATAIGSSGDRPASLAELVGILVADGVREPGRRLERLRFAEDTPWEAVLAADAAPGERLLPVEVARAVRGLMRDTVEQGTARRVAGALHGPDGTPLVIGGKTGTGDHRSVRVGPRGEVLEERSRARTATFAFFLEDRFYGVVTAFVQGPGSADYGFTSALPVEIVRLLGPVLERWAARPAADTLIAAGASR